jgi:hypothetical protein
VSTFFVLPSTGPDVIVAMVPSANPPGDHKTAVSPVTIAEGRSFEGDFKELYVEGL